MRWRRLFGLVPSRPGRAFSVQELLTALAAYAIILTFFAVVGARGGLDDTTGTAIGLFALFVLILTVRYFVERRIERQSGVRRR